MRAIKLTAYGSLFLKAFFLFLAFSCLFFGLSFLLPKTSTSQYYPKSLNLLRNKSKMIREEFSSILIRTQEMHRQVDAFLAAGENKDVYELFKKTVLNPEVEGIGLINNRGAILLWYGKVVDIQVRFAELTNKASTSEDVVSFLIHSKASYFLVSLRRFGEDYIALFRLLAFLPRFKAQYLKEFQFLNPDLMNNCNIDYFDFREDVSVFENIFARHNDEYIGEPRLQNQIQTIFFPLRNEASQIIATVTLSSPSLSSRISAQREDILFVFYLLLIVSFVCLCLYFIQKSIFFGDKKPYMGFFALLSMAAIRLLFFPLSQLGKMQSLPVFSPAAASFLSFWNLTKSPADIFLTTLFLFLAMIFIVFYYRRLFSQEQKPSTPKTVVVQVVLLIFIFGFIVLLEELLFRLVFNANINLLRFSLSFSFLLLHLSILLFALFFFMGSLTAQRVTVHLGSRLIPALFILSALTGIYALFLWDRKYPLLFFSQVLIILFILLFAHNPSALKKKTYLFPFFLIFSFCIYSATHHASTDKNTILVEQSLKNIIQSQEKWGIFLINQSLPEIDKRTKTIETFLQTYDPPDLAHSLWERTLMAKFNWYSSLELLGPQGAVLSRFSLNVPELYRIDFDLPPSRDWSLMAQTVPLMGREKDFLIGYRDYFGDEGSVGRLIIYLSVDYDMLPFLYSANPYFELLRVTSIPSLNQIDLGFAIYDREGKLLFNPKEISKGIPLELLDRIHSGEHTLWTHFHEKSETYRCLYFSKKNRIYALFLPVKTALTYSVEYLKLTLFYLFFLLLFGFSVSLFFSKKKWKNPFWSFSNRVYISFMAISLIPLILFTLSTRSFFSRLFTQQFTEEAEARAEFAKRVLEEYLFLQQEEQLSLTLPPDSLVLAISSTISNDVNLYQNGRLISSSRQEFYDYGLLPTLIDGEIYYKIQFENNPFYTQTQKIGDYSFHTLTVPYAYEDSLLLISLPFPLEKQKISAATADLIEFLVFISIFFVAAVLLFARGIGTMIVNPINRLLKGTKEVSLGNLEVSIPHGHEDEMKTLIEGFNSMVNSLKKHQQELADMSKKVAWAEMARKVAHEIKNPLTPIQLSAEHLMKVYEDRREDFDQTLKESVSYIIKEVENLRNIAQEFMEIAKETSLEKEPVDLKELIQETISPYRKVLAERIPFKEFYSGDDFTLEGDKAKIKIALRNIFTNAIEAIPDKGVIEIRAESMDSDIRLTVKDSGMGVPRELSEKIFELYFSTKEVGTGLGLPIARKIIEDHNGSIQVRSEQNVGTEVTIILPKPNDGEPAEKR